MGNNWEYGFVVIEDEGDFLEQMRSTYRKTVEHFDLLPPHELHGVYEAGTDVIVCHTGLSPNSRENAETIVALKAERDRLRRELEMAKAELDSVNRSEDAIQAGSALKYLLELQRELAMARAELARMRPVLEAAADFDEWCGDERCASGTCRIARAMNEYRASTGKEGE